MNYYKNAKGIVPYLQYQRPLIYSRWHHIVKYHVYEYYAYENYGYVYILNIYSGSNWEKFHLFFSFQLFYWS